MKHALRRLFVGIGCAVVPTLALVACGAGGQPAGVAGGGWTLTRFGGAAADANALVIQRDGRIVVAGVRYSGDLTQTDFAIARYLPDGSLDSSFGTGGKVTTTWGSSEEGADAIAIQPDGKLIVAGHWNWSYACSPRGRDVCERDESAFALGRYLRDGRLDTTFGTGGRVKTHLGGATAIAVEPDGKILVATDKSELVRYTPSGQLDRTFGAQGKVQLRMPGKPQKSLIALEGNGAIIAVGTWHITVRHGLDDVESGFTLTRLDAAGTPDRAFGIGGRVASRFRSWVEHGATAVAALAVERNGKIVLAGTKSAPGGITFALIRYTHAGRLDPGFGSHGRVATRVDVQKGGDYAAAVTVRGHGITVAGTSEVIRRSALVSNRFALARYLPDGRLDPAFGSGGRVVTSFGAGRGGSARAIAIQADGKAVVAGLDQHDAGFALARYLRDGRLDPDFGVASTDR